MAYQNITQMTDGGSSSYIVDIEEYYDIKCEVERIAEGVITETDRFIGTLEDLSKYDGLMKGNFADNVAALNDRVKVLLNQELETIIENVSKSISGYDNTAYTKRIPESDHLGE